MKKIFLVFIILLIGINIFCCGNVMADDFAEGINAAKNAQSNSLAVESTKSILATAIVVVRNVALGMAVIMLLVLSIKYMMAAPEGKASFRKSATIYILGAVLLFGTSGILTLLENFSTNL